MTETNKCQNCGSLVPAEKAFCPNCSEPMEPEESPARETFISGEMMTTIRDDPEHYRNLLKPPVKSPPAAAEAPSTEAQPTAAANRASSVVGYSSAPKAAPQNMQPPAVTGGSNKGLIIGISIVALLILVFVILWLLKVI